MMAAAAVSPMATDFTSSQLTYIWPSTAKPAQSFANWRLKEYLRMKGMKLMKILKIYFASQEFLLVVNFKMINYSNEMSQCKMQF